MQHVTANALRNVMLWLVFTSLVVLNCAPAQARDSNSARSGYFIEFVSRPTDYIVDHAFVRIGSVNASGAVRIDDVIGFYPRDFPRVNFSASLFDAPGVITRLPQDTLRRATARYRVMVDADTYRKARIHAGVMRRTWKRYDLFARNCNAVFFEFASRLGLRIPHYMLGQPAHIIADIRHAHRAGSSARWLARRRGN